MDGPREERRMDRRQRLAGRLIAKGVGLRVLAGILQVDRIARLSAVQRTWLAAHRAQILHELENPCPLCRQTGCAACEILIAQPERCPLCADGCRYCCQGRNVPRVLTCPDCEGNGCRFCRKGGVLHVC